VVGPQELIEREEIAMNSGPLEGVWACSWPRKVARAERWKAITLQIRSQILLRQHNARNRIVSMTDAIGTSTFGYTGARLLSFDRAPWSNSKISFGQNKRNERTQHTWTDNSCVHFGCDNLGQLTSALGSDLTEFRLLVGKQSQVQFRPCGDWQRGATGP
jgi:YD repeat-containing protein